jgi:hypothetical protein
MKLVHALLLLACGGLAASGASAQTRYHCRDSNGNSFVLSRPCPANTRTTAAVAGPVSSSSYGRSSSTPVRVPAEEPEHYQYMSARCRSLDSGIRSAYSRGIKPDVVEGMRREYKRDCREQEQEAYSQLSSERRDLKKQRREEEKSAQLAEQSQREQEQRFLQQCAESRRIIAAKRARTDLTEGERNELSRFEDAFLARCKR